MDIFAVSKKKSALSEGVMLFLSLAGLAMLLGIAIILPFILIPIALVGGVFLAWWHNPSRAEAKARALTEQLYDRVKVPVVDIEENLRTYTRNIPREVEIDLLDIGRRFYQVEGASDVPPVPAVCNSIEGARYRDLLSKVGATSAEREQQVLRCISFVVAYCWKERPFTQEKMEGLVSYVSDKKEHLRELHGWFREAFGKGVGKDYLEALEGTMLAEAMAIPGPVVKVVIPATYVPSIWR